MKTLKKIFVVTCCMAFVVMTVAPSSALPCCCKTTHSGKIPCSDHQIFPRASGSASCCSDKNISVTTCCDVNKSSDKIKAASPTEFSCQRCECPKNIQPLVVSENSFNERLITYEFCIIPSKVSRATERINSSLHCNRPLKSTLKSTPIIICSLRF